MAYGLLASVSAVYGLYTSLFASSIYWILGTSHHISVGSYAVVSMLVGTSVNKLHHKYAPPIGFNETLNNYNRNNNLTHVDSTYFLSTNHDKAIAMIVASQCFWIGLIHFFMGIFRLGFLSALLPEPLIKGFTAASAFLVCTSQIKTIFGLNLTTFYGSFKIIHVNI